MVKLTETEQAILDGEMGRFKQVALQKIIEYAQVLGAEACLLYTSLDSCKAATSWRTASVERTCGKYSIATT